MFYFPLTEGRSLRLVEERDAEEIYRVVDAHRVYLAEWMPWAAEQTLDEVRAFIGRARKQLADNDGFQAVVLDDARIVGNVGFHAVDWTNRSASIGYWLAEDAQGRGTMTLAVRGMADWGFGGWALNRIEIRAAPENARSRAIPERLGFIEEGTLRQAERVGDCYLDNIVYSVLASEWGTTTALPSN